MGRRLGILLLTLSLLGCDGGAPHGRVPAPDGPPQVGQRYWFSHVAPGAEQALTITAISPHEVRYHVQAFVEGAAVGEDPARPLELSFTPGPAPRGDPQTVELAGRTFTCVAEEKDGLTVLCAIEGERLCFPGVVRISEGQQTIFELVAVEAAP